MEPPVGIVWAQLGVAGSIKQRAKAGPHESFTYQSQNQQAKWIPKRLRHR